ncbi:hypothetical protein AB0G49_10575 [Streptomyces longwoodensis]|uniref:hypothetical protein n=1 Tax=Streptomyces longwoodensis TaxID=68231 RepID=UPI0033EF98FC
MRNALRTTLAAIALVGTVTVSVATASAAGAATTTATSGSSSCVATKTIPSVFGGWKVELVNRADSGAWAKLLDEKGEVVSTVDQSRTVDPAVGLRITWVLSAEPVFGPRSQGGSTPWKTTAFPALTADCTQRGTLVRTQRLDSRTTAQLFKVSAGHYQARVFQSGRLVRFIDAHDHSGAALFGSRTLVLNPDGTTVTWTGANPRTGRYRLANGAVVKLVKTHPQRVRVRQALEDAGPPGRLTRTEQRTAAPDPSS